MGDCHYFRGEFDKALKWYDKAIKSNPYHRGNWFVKGNALRRLGRNGEARKAYVRSLALRPHKEVVVKTLYKVDEDYISSFVLTERRRGPWRPDSP